jgi:glycosyltransferase involved in cell wall biosynthesis
MRRSNRTRRYDVCAAVISDLGTDARVWKQVRSLAAAGLRVKLIGCAYEEETTRRRTVDSVDVVEVPLGSRRGRVSPVGRFETLARVWREILVTRASVYHTHNVHPGPPSLLAARLRRAALVYDGHELFGETPGGAGPLTRAGARLNRMAEGVLVRLADEVITTNPSRAEELRSRYGRADICVLANVPPVVERICPTDPGFPPGRRVLLYQGGIYAESRAFRETLEALTMLDENVHFAILGFGRESSIALIERWAEELGVRPRVHLLGPLPFDELVNSAAAATVGLVPLKPTTLNQVTGDTNKLHEYLMAGLPVVGSDLPEIRRVLTEGDPRPGELFDPLSPASIADAVRRVIDDTRYPLRRETARGLALRRHNWGIEERKLLDLYGRLLRVPAASPSPSSERASR